MYIEEAQNRIKCSSKCSSAKIYIEIEIENLLINIYTCNKRRERDKRSIQGSSNDVV